MQTPKQKRSKISIQKKKSDKSKPVLVGIIMGLTVILVTLLVVQSNKNVNSAPEEPHVSLGAMQYDFSSGKAVRRSDGTVIRLLAFLVATARKDVSANCEPYYNVVAASSDEKQVLLKYGCGSPDARMFAVNKDGEWQTLSPTNHFDMFGIPECSYVSDNQIDKTIAPVCVSGLNSTDVPDTYSVR